MKNQFNKQHSSHHTQNVFADYRDLWNWNSNVGESHDVIAPHSNTSMVEVLQLVSDNHHDTHGLSKKFDGLVHAMASFAPDYSACEMTYSTDTDGIPQAINVVSVDTYTRHGNRGS